MDRLDSNGLRQFILNQGALVETLIQLSDFRQYDMAESMLAACEEKQLRQLLTVSDRAFSPRLTYSLEKQWQRSQDVAYKAKKSSFVVLVGILNTWCAEGRRSAIRCVLGEMQEPDLAALVQQNNLDREVYSMLYEYMVRQ
ncbi:hypothetical protein EKH79_11735 [Dyella dinghuensis]|uniref:Uncharacterized protein n=1 Tax=Dyella dinghuensis TaxID=1920169 RepID=A0A432LRB3_9GAMM|nr:hypothetical protein [Dyella dinghuensis]RUL63079.1 hypothetical protein EKH79_11735 [Dyella dinghuensis]